MFVSTSFEILSKILTRDKLFFLQISLLKFWGKSEETLVKELDSEKMSIGLPINQSFSLC